MRTIGRAIGFVVFAVAAQFLFWVLKLDILEDFNIFGEWPCWAWLGGAVALIAILDCATGRLARPLMRHGLIFGVLGLLLLVGWIVPQFLSGEGLGILRFLNTQWLLTAAAYWVGVIIVSRIRRKHMANLQPTRLPRRQPRG